MSRSVPLGRCLGVALLSSLATLVLLDALGAEAVPGKKYALLVGVRAYDNRKLEDLKYTENDVEELARELKGFTEVVVLTTTRGKKNAEAAPTAANIRAQLGRLLKRVTKHDTIVVGLAGHGLQMKVKVKDREIEEGFFCPSDARPREDVTLAQQSETMIGFTELFKGLDESGVGVKLLLVDACRNDPKAGRSVNADAMPRAPKGTAALFSCRSGERAFETDKLGKGHGVFFHYVLKGLRGEATNKRREVTWGTLAEYVVEKVSDEVPVLIGAGAKQTPEEIRKLEGKPPVLVVLSKTSPGKDWGQTIENSIGMRLVRIKSGRFTMGSPKAENGPDDERPQHEVTITKAFYLGVYLVTQTEYEQVTGSNPSWFSSGGRGKDKVSGRSTSKFPVEQVSWEDAVKFCNNLSELEKEKVAGREYRLPTEAEWEYACRAGTKTRYHSGDDEDDLKDAGWYDDNSDQRTHEVGEKKANAWGLYDMHGNVWQWCADWYGKHYYKGGNKTNPQGPESAISRVLRGGSWNLDARNCRAALRNYERPDLRFYYIGFRVVCVPSGSR
jgi:formylglycine-generating enzyme required for sulfatase activity